MTGNVLKNNYKQINCNCQEILDYIWAAKMETMTTNTLVPVKKSNEVASLTVAQILKKLQRRNDSKGRRRQDLIDGKWQPYFQDQSCADLSLVNDIAFFAGPHPDIIDATFRKTKLMRSKWDEKHCTTGETYGQRTIAKAIEGCRNTYAPTKKKKDIRTTPS